MVVSNAKPGDAVSLTKMYDKLEFHLRALESLGITSEQTSEFLYPMVESSLPEDILIAWQRSTNYGRDGSQEEPPLNEMDFLMRFLRGEVQSEEQRLLARTGFVDVSEGKKVLSKDRKFKQREKHSAGIPTAYNLVAGQTTGCLFCNKAHASQDCIKAQKLTLTERKEKVRESNHCFACLKPNHTAKNCKSLVKCLLCGRKHYTLLCYETEKRDRKDEKKVEASESTMNDVQTTLASHVACSSSILLMTCLVRIKGSRGKIYICRALFDSGSHLTRIRKSTATSLGLKPIERKQLRVAVYGGDVITAHHSLFNFEIESLDGKVKRCVEAFDEGTLCGAMLPPVPKRPWLEELAKKGIRFNDIESNYRNIDLIIGSQYIQNMLTGERVDSVYGYTAVQTVFGWTLTGALNDSRCKEQTMAMMVTAQILDDADITKLWELEAIGIKDPVEKKTKAEQDIQAALNLVKSLKRYEKGRYSVSLPWKNGGIILPDNKSAAERRLRNVTVKLEDSGYFDVYDNVFNDWINEEIIELKLERSGNDHFWPHRPVFKPNSLTTPVRPVFDASSRVGKRPSLNDCLEKGPNYIEMIPDILIRFRMRKLGVTSDIRKAFQIIEINKQDRDALSFLWWEHSEQKKQVKEFRHKRVVFGLKCSPFILGAILEYHCKNVCELDRPYAIQLLKSMYVDNCVTSVETQQEYLDFKGNATRILADCEMELRQWECSFLFDDTHSDVIREDANVLGIRWNKSEDTLSCYIELRELPQVLTKRLVLSTVQKIFDPLGFLCPVMIVPKLFLQQIWIQKMSWDQELKPNDSDEFRKWYSSLSHLAELKIPRHISYSIRERSLQLHIFCDASIRAYAAVAFLRLESEGEVSVCFVHGKSRIAPLKKATMPRLELLACLIGARLGDSIKTALENKNLECHYWTNSTIALAWIQRNDLWGTFVENRTREINSLTVKETWKHVPGEVNPADLPSRGCSAMYLMTSKWWNEPSWLGGSPEYWPMTVRTTDESQVQSERKKSAVLCMIAPESGTPWYIKASSSYTKNVRIMCYILLFIRMVKEKHRTRGEAAMIELNQREKLKQVANKIQLENFQQAEEMMFLLAQRESFSAKGDVIAGLKIVRENHGLIRVATRLILGDDDESFRYPILLPNAHALTTQLIRHEHLTNCHAGAQFLMGKLRERCWITKSRKAIRKVIQSCIICKRYVSKPPTTPAPPLPEDRIKKTAPFDVTGIDLAGPLYLRYNVKAWIIIFTCAVYR